jgi:hypothetical protein
MRKLILRTGSQTGREIELKPGLNRVGRNASNDIQIEDPSVSSFHCELQVSEIAVAIRDLNSTNGTQINHSPVTKGVLQSGDVLTLGEIECVVELPEVQIALPKMETFEPAGAAFLEDGRPACFNHRDAVASFACTKCENWWCSDCVRPLKRLSGEFLYFCAECSGPCIPLELERVARKKWLERVADTLRIPRKK